MKKVPEPHDIVRNLPSMSEEQVEALAQAYEDGLEEVPSVLLYEGKVLDGRSALKACQLAGIEPHFEEFEGTEGDAFRRVLTSNYLRTHASKEQRAAFGALLLDRKDELEWINLSNQRPRAAIGERLNVSGPLIQSALRILRADKTVFENLLQGRHRSVEEAKRAADLPAYRPKSTRATGATSSKSDEKCAATSKRNNEVRVQPPRHLSPLIWPGSKRTLAPTIASIVEDLPSKPRFFVEGFAGAAWVSLELLTKGLVKQIGLVDKDPLVVGFWKTVFNSPDPLCEFIQTVDMSISQREFFEQFEAETNLEKAQQCLFLCRTSYNGVLLPSGRRNDLSQWWWPREELVGRVRYLSRFADRVEFIECDDTLEILPKLDADFFYLDPPYVKMGKRLYKHFFDSQDHQRLHDTLQGIGTPWLVSYDNCEEVATLYGDAQKLVPFEMHYNGNNDGKKGGELLISNFEFDSAALDDLLENPKNWTSSTTSTDEPGKGPKTLPSLTPDFQKQVSKAFRANNVPVFEGADSISEGIEQLVVVVEPDEFEDALALIEEEAPEDLALVAPLDLNNKATHRLLHRADVVLLPTVQVLDESEGVTEANVAVFYFGGAPSLFASEFSNSGSLLTRYSVPRGSEDTAPSFQLFSLSA